MYKFAALFSASMIFASMANAEGFYVGGSFGASEATLSTNTQFADPDDRLYLVKGFGGYRVNDFLPSKARYLALQMTTTTMALTMMWT
jgi:hypothetical protein